MTTAADTTLRTATCSRPGCLWYRAEAAPGTLCGPCWADEAADFEDVGFPPAPVEVEAPSLSEGEVAHELRLSGESLADGGYWAAAR